MATLLIDTALHCAQVALFRQGKPVAAAMRAGDRGQAEVLMPLLNDVLAGAKLRWKDLTQVTVTVGPGVFTGIRTGIAVARALRLSLGIPVTGVSTLQALAASADLKGESVLALIDAHKGEAYAQLFSPELQALSEPMLLKADALAPYMKEAQRVVAYPPAFAAALSGEVQACSGLEPGAFSECTPLEPLPLYVRAPDALPQAGGLKRRA